MNYTEWVGAMRAGGAAVAVAEPRSSLENPRVPLDPWSGAAGGAGLEGDLSLAGVRVGRSKALTVAAVWRAVHLIADTVAKLPLGVVRVEGGDRHGDPDHPAHRVLRVEPNPAMTPFVLKQLLTSHVLLEGNGYAYVYRAASGRPLELWPLDPRRTEPIMTGGQLWYVHALRGGEKRKLAAADVIHLPGLGYDGLKGYSVLQFAKESIGLAIASTAYGGVFFRNGARPGVLLKHPGKLSPEARKNLRESWERMHSGLDNAHRTAILEEGADAVVTQINAHDAQLIESKQFSIVDVGNWFGVPPNRLGAPVNTSYGSLEQDNQFFLDYGVGPRLVLWEQACEAKLLTPKERASGDSGIVFDRFSMQTADMDKRANYYQKAVTSGWMSADEVRMREGMNPQPAAVGTSYARPLNLGYVGGPDAPDAGASASGLVDLPDVRQAEGWDCGPAAAAAVMSFFGRTPDTLAGLVAALGTTPERGTAPPAVMALLSRAGLTATARGGMTADDLARFHAAGQPVLCPCRPGGDAASGHWVAVIGVGFGQVFLQDPAIGRRMLPLEEWEAQWKDVDADGVAYGAFGIGVGEELLPGPAAAAEDEPDPAPDGPEGGGGGDAAKAARAVVLETLRRAVRRIAHNARRAAGKPTGFLRWLDGVESAHGAAVASMLAAPLESLAASGGPRADAAAVAGRLAAKARAGLLEAAGAANAAGLPDAVARWARESGDDAAGLTALVEG